MEKLRVTQVYEKLSEELKEQIKLEYPYGFSQHLIPFFNKEGKSVKALRYETEEKIYLVRMTILEAEKIVKLDDDYDEDGNLKDDVKEEYEDKYSDDIDELIDAGNEDDDDD